jgi:ribosomal protein L37AE/L43A
VSDELKLCPFCGNEPRYLAFKPGFWTDRVICDSCNFYLAPDAWNRRALGDRVQSNALRAELNAETA